MNEDPTDEEEHPQRTSLHQIRRRNVLLEREKALRQRDDSLKYGHLGSAFYDIEERRWEFKRRMKPGPSLRLISGPTCLMQSPLKILSRGEQSQDIDRRRARELAQTAAEAPVDILRREERISNKIDLVASYYDPTLLDRMANGHAYMSSIKLYHGPTIPILAIVAGENGNAVKFTIIQTTEYGWPDKSGTTVEIPELGDEEAWWHGNGAPIQQVKSLSTVEQPEVWMAASHSTSTTVFRPIYSLKSNQLTPVSSTGQSIHTTSRLHPNPIVTISLRQTGCASHVDVAFNPWFPQQLAIIDRLMYWSLWDIRSTPYSQATKSLSHRMESDEFGCNIATVDPVDGWARVTWVDVDKLVVGNRRHLQLYHIGDQPKRISTEDLYLLLGSEWILDIKNNPLALSELLVLTNSRVIWLRLAIDDTRDENGDSPPKAFKTLFSWRHFRFPDDISLCFTAQSIDDHTISVTVYSRLNFLALLYQLAMPTEEASIHTSVSDPSPIVLSLENASSSSSTSYLPMTIASMKLENLRYKPKSEDSAPGIGTEYVSKGIGFFKILALASDLSLNEWLYASQRDIDGSDWQSGGSDEDIEFPSVRINQRGPQKKRKAKTATTIHQDDFLADDYEDNTFSSPVTAMMRHVRESGRKGLANVRDRANVNAELLYTEGTKFPGKNDRGQSLESCVSNVQRALKENKAPHPLRRTIPELLELTPKLADLHLTQREFLDAFQAKDTSDPDLQSMISPIPLSEVWLDVQATTKNTGIELDAANQPSTYSYLRQCWGGAAGSAENDNVEEKDFILNQVASELFLAGFSIVPRTTALQQPRPLESAQSTTQSTLPVRKRCSPAELTKQTAANNNMALNSLPPYPSTSTKPSSPIDSPANTTLLLQKYTAIKPTLPLSKRASSVLDHWEPGLDPNTSYSWSRKEAELSMPTAEEFEAYQKEARLARKRKEKDLQHGGRFEDNNNTPRETGSRTTRHFEGGFGGVRSGGSMPAMTQMPVVDVQRSSSSQVDVISGDDRDDKVAATQVERGVFGGRNAWGGKQAQRGRNKRKAGF